MWCSYRFITKGVIYIVFDYGKYMNTIESWGSLKRSSHKIITPGNLSDMREVLSNSKESGIPFGKGRSYGDVCLNPGGVVWNTRKLDHFISVDSTNGRLVCEPGVILKTIQETFIPRGWSLPVTPGTQMVTVGGAIANDIHGKNHHKFGSFGDHVKRIVLIRTGGEIIDCGPDILPDWFCATVGGLGLTGVVVSAEIQLVPINGPWMNTETIAYKNLDEFFYLADSSEEKWEHTVAWLDANSGDGRGIFMRGNSAILSKVNIPNTSQRSLPFTPPFSLINRLTSRPLSFIYYHKNKFGSGNEVQYYESFLYPLDRWSNWNRMYGPKGFYQYQCLVPRTNGPGIVKAILKEVKKSGCPSFLSVLKTFGDRSSVGMLGFPKPGVTLALDFPNDGEKVIRLFESIDDIVRGVSGRIYPAKDARMPSDMLESGYPRLKEFLSFRDPGVTSGFSKRLLGN